MICLTRCSCYVLYWLNENKLRTYDSNIDDKKVHAMNQIDAMTYLKEASALLGLLLIVYLWSLVAMALQV